MRLVNYIFTKSFGEKIVNNIQKDLIVTRDVLYVVLISIYGFFLYILEFSTPKKFVSFFNIPIIMYFVGIVFTQLPHYIVIIMSFIPPLYTIPVYVISFVYMFLV
jgi:hypothetical protein